MLAGYKVNQELDDGAYESYKKCRKTKIPNRSLSISNELSEDEKYIQGIVNLDVYSIYNKNPESLLRSASNWSLSTPTSAISTEVNTASHSVAASPLISTGVIDMSAFKNTMGAPAVIWKKGGVLIISPDEQDYNYLTPEELKISSTLRVLPSQYLHIKETILTQVHLRGPFKKRDAKSWFRIDVNKTAILFDWFRALGWIPSDEEWL